jgi:hypothetical protein
VVLTWPGPAQGKQEPADKSVYGAWVYRLVERRDQEPVLDRQDYRNAASQIYYLNRLQIQAQLSKEGFLHWSDPLDFTAPGTYSNLRLRYSIAYVNSREQEAPFSNTVAIEPFPTVSKAPGQPSAVDTSQDHVTLTWKPPDANVDGTTPAAVVGYNVYRRRVSDPEPELLNAEPLGDARFVDTKFKYEVPYIYTVRALSQGTSGLIESADSLDLTHTPQDRFKPSAPDPVSIASANSVISLFWPTSPERDVVGYLVYRSESQQPAAQEWTRLTPEPIPTVTYRDEHVTLGTRYYYRVTAIDKFKNESESSTIVSEVANP